MGDYTYLDNLGPAGESNFGTAAYADVGTADDELPTMSDVENLVGPIGSGNAIQALHFFTASQSFTLRSHTARCLCVVIGGGGGGESDYYYPKGGGAGGVSIALVPVTGGQSVSVTVGSGGTGGNNGNSGADGTVSSFGGIESEGGHGQPDSMYESVGGAGSTDHNAGLLWGKRGGGGYSGIYSSPGPGGNPWAEYSPEPVASIYRVASTSASQIDDAAYAEPIISGGTNPVIDGSYNSWNAIASSMTAQYGCGGAGAPYNNQADNGGSGIVIVLEIS